MRYLVFRPQPGTSCVNLTVEPLLLFALHVPDRSVDDHPPATITSEPLERFRRQRVEQFAYLTSEAEGSYNSNLNVQPSLG